MNGNEGLVAAMHIGVRGTDFLIRLAFHQFFRNCGRKKEFFVEDCHTSLWHLFAFIQLTFLSV